MTVIPAERFLRLAGAGVVGSLALLFAAQAGPFVAVYFLLLLLAAAIDYAITPKPATLTLHRDPPGRLSVLSEIVVRVKVVNAGPADLRFRLIDLPPATFQTDAGEWRETVPARGEREWTYPAKPLKRGRFAWGPMVLRYRSLLGFWEMAKRADPKHEAAVYPDVSDYGKYHVLARSNQLAALGIRQVRIRGGNSEFESLREYSYGDDTRLIDWKATARRARPIIRNQRPERNQTLILLLDTGRLMNAEEAGVSKLDRAINTSLMLSLVALSRGDRVGICTFSGQVRDWLAPRGNAAQGQAIADLLFDLKGDFSESDHGRCLRQLSVRHPKRAMLIVITDFVDAQTASEMLAYVQQSARRHLVMFVALKDAFLQRAARSKPANAREAYRKSAAVELLRDREEVLERLRQCGVFVIDADPGEITPPVINRYLELTFRGLL